VRSHIPSSILAAARLMQKRVRWRLAAVIGIAALAGCLLASCSKYELVEAHPEPARIPLPKQALLTREPEPGCTAQAAAPETHGDLRPPALHHAPAAMFAAAGASDSPRLPVMAASGQSDGALAQADPNLGLAQRIKLEYERDCFRRAEQRTREKLLKLQQAVAVPARAVKRAEQARP
jgi:hypothetical protein